MEPRALTGPGTRVAPEQRRVGAQRDVAEAVMGGLRCLIGLPTGASEAPQQARVSLDIQRDSVMAHLAGTLRVCEQLPVLPAENGRRDQKSYPERRHAPGPGLRPRFPPGVLQPGG